MKKATPKEHRVRKKSAPEKPSVQARTPLQRMLRIHHLLQAETYPNSTLLSKKLECCVRTLRRDIEFMRETLNLPVAYDERRYGFYYTEKVKQFPTVKLTTGELISLCVARQSVEAHRGTPFEAQLRSAFEKITHGMQEEISFRWDELASAFSFRANGCEVPVDLEILSALSTAVLEGEEVAFGYKKLQRKKCEQRLVEPLHLTCADNAWYLLCYDLHRTKYRTFLLSRMSDLRRTGRKFEKREDFDVEKLLANSIGIYKGGKAERVRLHARGFAAGLLAERSWHSSQRVKELPGTDGEEVEVTMKVAITPELERWILSWGAEVRVLEPESLREKIRATVRAMAEGY